MKELLVLRHAKSTHADPRLADHDRPLNERGRRAAPRVGRLLSREGLVPERVFCSTATRTMETAALVCAATGREIDASFHEELYLAPPDRILDLVIRSANDFGRIMVVGHNPGVEDVLTLLGLGMHETLARLVRERQGLPRGRPRFGLDMTSTCTK